MTFSRSALIFSINSTILLASSSLPARPSTQLLACPLLAWRSKLLYRPLPSTASSDLFTPKANARPSSFPPDSWVALITGLSYETCLSRTLKRSLDRGQRRSISERALCELYLSYGVLFNRIISSSSMLHSSYINNSLMHFRTLKVIVLHIINVFSNLEVSVLQFYKAKLASLYVKSWFNQKWCCGDAHLQSP